MTVASCFQLLSCTVLAVFLFSESGTAESLQTQPSPYASSLDYQRWRWAFDQRAYPLGYLPADAKLRETAPLKSSSPNLA